MRKPPAPARSPLALPLFGAAALLMAGLYTAYSLSPSAATPTEAGMKSSPLLTEAPQAGSVSGGGSLPSFPAPAPDPDSAPAAYPSPLPEPPVPLPESDLQEKPPASPASPAPDGRKLAALTFDDGPDGRYTPQILDILKKHEVKATFFVVGRQAQKYPEVLRRISDEGHRIGNHSWDHADLSKLSGPQLLEEIAAGDEAVRQVTGSAPVLFRAPYGAVSEDVRRTLASLGRPLVGWTVDTRDWAGTPHGKILQTVKERLRPGGIVLMHSFGGRKNSLENTLQALPAMIEALQADGYTLVTADELPAARRP
ncbi:MULTISPECIES: polysaccharide deacetylase family protein [Paenibacillus]|uniref:polysaccharide deacetylase family protein n=1 Tax=Paenibacillus TaxID=44249 RepID=UPI0022B91BDF|nr:polysaccharide deacetylase family protein [Paenibacillus caseinilyticus]MCZ8519674.1 polysaccharide deacetylase family protein [Paenibacillus caseinilyticus]